MFLNRRINKGNRVNRIYSYGWMWGARMEGSSGEEVVGGIQRETMEIKVHLRGSMVS